MLAVSTQGLQTNDSAESAGNGTNDSPGMPAVLTQDGRQTNDSAESAGNGTNDSPGMPAVSTRERRQTNDSAESAGNGTNDSPGMPAVWNDPQGDHNDGSQTSEVAEYIICCSSIVELECQVLLTCCSNCWCMKCLIEELKRKESTPFDSITSKSCHGRVFECLACKTKMVSVTIDTPDGETKEFSLEASGNRESIHAARITVIDSLIELVDYWSPTSEQTKDAEIIWLTLQGS